MHPHWRDTRGPHVITRGNVDGILSAAMALHNHPRARVSFVPSSTTAVDVIRRDISSDLVVLDLGLEAELIRALNNKAKTHQKVLFLDHHQQSTRGYAALGPHVTIEVQQGKSATSVAQEHFGIDHLGHLAALADHLEYCASGQLEAAIDRYGEDRIEEEARHLDYAWRYHVEDDRFRRQAARSLAHGHWPSQISEVQRRYLIVHNEGRFERAKQRVRERLRLRGQVAILEFGKRKPSLFGFGSRAMSAVARETEADVAVLVTRRGERSSLSLRGFHDEVNLGRFIQGFTQEHGLVGGGHPASAGARIHTQDLPLLLDELVNLAPA